MSTIVTNRVRSAHPRSSSRSPRNIKQRPITSMGTHRSNTDVFEQPIWRRSVSVASHRQTKTDQINSISDEIVHPDEVTRLLRSLNRSDTFIVQVDCLANYRKLVETINLKQTPVDYKSLCALQQRENRIIQRNACRDTRFRSLLDTLQPAYIIEVKENQSNDINDQHVSEYQSNPDDNNEY